MKCCAKRGSTWGLVDIRIIYLVAYFSEIGVYKSIGRGLEGCVCKFETCWYKLILRMKIPWNMST